MGPALHGNAVYKGGRNLHRAPGPVEPPRRRRLRARVSHSAARAPSASAPSVVPDAPRASATPQPHPFFLAGGGGGVTTPASVRSSGAMQVMGSQICAPAWESQLSMHAFCTQARIDVTSL